MATDQSGAEVLLETLNYYIHELTQQQLSKSIWHNLEQSIADLAIDQWRKRLTSVC